MPRLATCRSPTRLYTEPPRAASGWPIRNSPHPPIEAPTNVVVELRSRLELPDDLAARVRARWIATHKAGTEPTPLRDSSEPRHAVAEGEEVEVAAQLAEAGRDLVRLARPDLARQVQQRCQAPRRSGIA